MDLSKLSIIELWKLYNKIGWIIFAKTWWIILLIVAAFMGFSYLYNKYKKKKRR